MGGWLGLQEPFGFREGGEKGRDKLLAELDVHLIQNHLGEEGGWVGEWVWVTSPVPTAPGPPAAPMQPTRLLKCCDSAITLQQQVSLVI